jgi:radical SAM superfamily enzyme YgiQ (UPF0313 family)
MSILLLSLPGTYPSFPAVGLEIVAQRLKEKNHAVTTIQGHLEIVEFLDETLLRMLCQQNMWDLLYAHLVYSNPDIGLRNRKVLSLLTDSSQSYRIAEDELIVIASAIARFNRYLLRRIAGIPRPSVVGFSIQNNQVLVAKYFAREVKELWGKALRTIVGGASIRDGLGRSILVHHPEFDFASEKDGASEIDGILKNRNPAGLAGLIFRRDNGRLESGSSPGSAGKDIREHDLDYAEFYVLRRQYGEKHDFSIFHPWDGVPALIASGCRWGQCRFCNLRDRHRQFPPRAVVDSIIRRTKTAGIAKAFLLDLSQPDGRTLRRFFGELEKRDVSCLFGAMFRCDIRKKDLVRFRKNGLDICHLGIEAYSDRLLQQMNKGVRLIDIVQTIITCVEEGIQAEGNLLVNLPWEEAEDIEETERNLSLLSHLPLPRIISYMLSQGSIEFEAPDLTRRKQWLPETLLRYAYPLHLRNRVQTMYYSKKSPRLEHEAQWMRVIANYRRYAAHPPLLTYEIFKDGLAIHDTRDTAKQKRSFLNGSVAARIYQFCGEIRTFAQISRRFPSVSASELNRTLESFIAQRTMMRSDDRYLGIALKRN